LQLGLIHQLCTPEELPTVAAQLREGLLQNGPQALTEAKSLLREVVGQPIDDEMVEMTAERIAAIRATSEGREGLSAFLTKRPPKWNHR